MGSEMCIRDSHYPLDRARVLEFDDDPVLKNIAQQKPALALTFNYANTVYYHSPQIGVCAVNVGGEI